MAVVVAEALTYLHEECSPPVIHRDIKSSNILLSDDFQPQVLIFFSCFILYRSIFIVPLGLELVFPVHLACPFIA